MKLFLFGVFSVIFATKDTVASKCSDESLQVLEKCYNRLFIEMDFSFPYLAPSFIQDLKEDFSTSDGVVKRCKHERKFRRCLRNYVKEDVISNCVNIESYSGLTFNRNVTKWAREYVASFFETDYACTTGYKTLVFFNDCINRIPSLCNFDNSSSCQENYFKCMKDTTEKECGIPAGCFALKDAKISVCYDGDTQCDYCQNLDYNNNFYNKLCNTDASFIPPTTPYVPTTTTTLDNSTINIIVVTRRQPSLEDILFGNFTGADL